MRTIIMTRNQVSLSALCGLAVVAFLTQSVAAQDHAKVVVVRAMRHVSAPPLSQVVPIAPQGVQPVLLNDDGEDDKVVTHGINSKHAVEDAALQASSEATNSLTLPVNVGVDVLGLGNGLANFSGATNIPDTNGAAGPTQFVQFVNDSFAVFNKSNGSLAYGPAHGNTLWQSLGGGCAASPNLDEIAQFDKLANVWVMMMPDFESPAYICVAVSTTSDAVNSGWNLYAFRTPVNTTICNCRPMTDYPKLAVWSDGYYLSWNEIWNGNYIGSEACVVDRNSMLRGAAATMQCVSNTGASYGSMLPADLDGTTPPPSGSPEYYLDFNGNDQSLDLWRFSVNWTNPANSTWTGPTNIPVAAFTEACGENVVEFDYTTGDCVPQAGTSITLDSYGDRLMYRVAYRNFGSYQSMVANHTVQTGTSSAQTGIRWYELQNTGSGFGLHQQGTYAPDASYRWMGSIAMDKVGDIALGYSVSSSTMSPSIRYTGRVPGDTLGTMEGEVDVLSGAGVTPGSRTNNFRWADYSSLAVDPADDCTFWYTTEYMPTNGGNWSTRIASFSFPSCTETSTLSTLTVNETGSGTVTSGDGQINCTNGNGTCSTTYSPGSSVTLHATAATGYTFTGWSGACSGRGPCTLVMNSDQTASAAFVTTPAWAVVHKASSGGAITSLTIPATGAGHLIAVALMFNGKTSVSRISDNAGNTYVSAGARAVNGVGSVEIWYAQRSLAGATVITPTFANAPTSMEITAWEVSGVLAISPDATSTATGTITLNNTPGPPVTTTMAGDFVVSVLFALNTNINAITSGNEFTNDFLTWGNGWAHISSNSSAATIHQASWYTSSPVGPYCASTVAFAP